MTRRRALPLLALLPALALAGCVSLSPKVPPRLLRLEPATLAPVDNGRDIAKGAAIMIGFPTAPVELANNRVPVRISATEIAYVKDAQWVDMPAHLFRDLLAETITARTGRPALAPREALLAGGGPRLYGRLGAFGIDAPGHQAIVMYDATLARPDKPVETRRFEARAPVPGAITAASAATAINAAANNVAVQVADWAGR